MNKGQNENDVNPTTSLFTVVTVAINVPWTHDASLWLLNRLAF